MRQFSITFVSMIFLLSIAACASPTPMTIPVPTVTPPIPRTATRVSPTLTPSQATPQATATQSANLRKDSIVFVAPLSADDSEVITQALENLSGVQDVQTNGQQFQVTYDSKQVTLSQIITVMKGFGFPIKE
jgi:copper chaperone CopZ